MANRSARELTEYDTLAEFEDEGGASKYGRGYVLIGGGLCWSDGSKITDSILVPPSGDKKGIKDRILIQSIMNDGRVAVLSRNRYYIDTPLQPKAEMSGIKGVGTSRSRQSAPYYDSRLKSINGIGTVIEQVSAAADIVQFTKAGLSAYLEGFVGTWSPGVRFVNTGNGVTALAEANAALTLGGHDHSCWGGQIKDVFIIGADGNHYGFDFLNSLFVDFIKCETFGGGGFKLWCDSMYGNYGNTLFQACMANLVVPGTAHAFHLKSRSASGWGFMNLVNFLRTQANVTPCSAYPDEISTAGPDMVNQYALKADENVRGLGLFGADFEPFLGVGNAANARVALPSSYLFNSSEGIMGHMDGQVQPMWKPSNLATTLMSDFSEKGVGFYHPIDTAGTAAPYQVRRGANAGDAVDYITLDATALSDKSGTVSWGTQTAGGAAVTGMTAGAQVRVNLHRSDRGKFRVVLTPNNAATAALGLYVVKDNTDPYAYFDICTTNVPTNNQPAGTYSVDFVIEYY